MSSWCWSRYRWLHVITDEFLMLKPVQVTARDHMWVLDVEASTGDGTWSQVSSWCWSQYRWRHVHSWVNSLVVKMMTSSRLPRPTHTSQDRSVSSSTFWRTSLELCLPVMTLTLSRPAAAETLLPISRSSLLCSATVLDTSNINPECTRTIAKKCMECINVRFIEKKRQFASPTMMTPAKLQNYRPNDTR